MAASPGAADFGTRPETVSRLLGAIEARMAGVTSFTALDLGCGAGGLALAIADRWGGARVSGLDLSNGNIAEARRATADRGLASRVDFRSGDFLTSAAGPFDLLVADSVLHLIPGTTEELAARLAGSLAPGGLLFATLPHRSVGNGLRLGARRVWRLLPGGADRLALAVARRLHPDVPAALLADRLPYLRLVHARPYDRRFAAALAAVGLSRVDVQAWPSDSVAKPAHSLIVYRKAA